MSARTTPGPDGVRRPRGSGVRADSRGDGGHTLVEMVTATFLIAVLLMAFGVAVRLMVTTTARTRSLADATTSSRAANQLLGRSLPYAARANTPTRVGDDWYLELWTDATVTGTPQCTQWRVRGAQDDLQRRTWSAGTTQASSWVTVARLVTNDPATRPPFTVYPADSGFALPRVVVDLVFLGSAGGGASAQGVFALRNAGATDPVGTDVVCTEVGRS